MVDSLGQLLAAGSFDVGTPPPSSVGTWTRDAWDVALLPIGGVGAGLFRMFSGFDGRPSVLAGNLYELIDDAWQRTDLGLGGVTYAAIHVEDVGLVVGGHFNTVNGQSARSVVTWDGTNWHAMGSGMNSAVYALLAHSDGGIYAGGNFASAGSATTRAVARWDGADWTAVGGGLGVHAEVRALAELPNGDIIAAGEFTTAGGITANNIARWDGSQWHPLGGGTNGVVRALAVLEDGSLAVGGDFTHVDGKPSAYFARYVFPGSPPAITSQPVDSFACMNAPATFVATAAGDATYQWQIADPLAPEGWSDLADGELEINGATVGFVEGADTGSLTFAPIAATFHTEVRCVVSSQCAEATSDTASLSVCRVDTDCDGLLSDSDFFTFFDAFLACDGSPPGCVSGTTDPDFNRDEVVDIMDFLEYLDSYGTGCL